MEKRDVVFQGKSYVTVFTSLSLSLAVLLVLQLTHSESTKAAAKLCASVSLSGVQRVVSWHTP